MIDANLVVVTIVKDDCEAFLKTLESVIQQTQDMRHIVIDGSTKKENQEMIAIYCGRKGSIYVYQQARGIYAAMNFGLSMCHGDEMVLFLNAGDCFAKSTSAKQIEKDLALSSSKFLIYPCVFGEGRGFTPSIKAASAKTVSRGEALICHQGVIVSAELIRLAGSFDETYAVSADHKLILRLLQLSQPLLLAVPIAVVSLGGISDTNCGALVRENSRARAETGLSFDSELMDKFYTVKRLIRCKAKLVIRKLLKSFKIPSDLSQRIVHRR